VGRGGRLASGGATLLPLVTGSGLESATAEAFRAGQAAWPGVAISIEAFTAHVRGSGAGPGELAQHGADIYLACGCALGDRLALQLFDQRVLPRVVQHVARLRVKSEDLDEIRQILRMRLFAHPRRIVGYAGRGSLVRWVRLVATRIALEDTRALRSEAAADEGHALATLIAGGDEPELSLIRERLREPFQRALQESFADLAPRSRDILRMHYIEGMSFEEIGSVYDVHRATVARWLVGIRSAVVRGMSRRLWAGAEPSSSDLRSLIRALWNELDISLGQFLRPEGSDAR
jgi:RNA polymerase sigma-70 factor (ECF subfamily)